MDGLAEDRAGGPVLPGGPVVEPTGVGGGGGRVDAGRTAGRADFKDRRRLPDRAPADAGAFLPRRPARDPGRPEHHRLGRLLGRDLLPAARRPERHGGRDRMVGDARVVPVGQPDAAAPLGASDGPGDRGGDRPAVPRPAQPGPVASPRPVQLPDRGPDRRRLPGGGQPVPRAGGARGAAGRGKLDATYENRRGLGWARCCWARSATRPRPSG